jgi:hypothetical protein
VTYSAVADLELTVEEVRLEPLELDVGGWTRRSTVVWLAGGGHAGEGEDVTYEPEDQLAFRAGGPGIDPRGRWTLDAFCRSLDDFALFPEPRGGPVSRRYRRWAFESAALDLALRQSNESLAGRLGLTPRPVRFVVSCGLGEPPSLAPLRRRLERYPALRFKVDFSNRWTPALVEQLAATGVVDVVDLKGLYRGAFSGPAADAGLYAAVAEGLPGAWLEDPDPTPEAWAALAPHRDRVTWDACLHSVADIALRPARPRTINVKPSRFGSLAELFAVYDYCRAHGIGMYGGGQFELGPGRAQIQSLASLFHPDAPNDVSPVGYHRPELPDGLPSAVLHVDGDAPGFR